MELEYSKFTLTPKKSLNHFSEMKTREGVYFKLGEHYTEYTPWSEFGDLSVDDYLNQIREMDSIPSLIQKKLDIDSLRFDLEAKGFYNHKLNELNAKMSKLKIDSFISKLNTQDLYNYSGLLRVDCNNKFTYSEFLDFYNTIPNSILTKINYFEDPCPNISDNWDMLLDKGIPLACDRNDKTNGSYNYIVYKAGIELPIPTSKNTIFSSYMGSDLERYQTYLELIHTGDLKLIHGIHTPNLFDKQLTLFSDLNDLFFPISSDVIALYGQLKGRLWKKI